MRAELMSKIVEENKYIDLLKANPRFRLQGNDRNNKKVVIGIIQGNPREYNQGTDHLTFKYFDSWKDAYLQLV